LLSAFQTTKFRTHYRIILVQAYCLQYILFLTRALD
jgi:hypothetical protein